MQYHAPALPFFDRSTRAPVSPPVLELIDVCDRALYNRNRSIEFDFENDTVHSAAPLDDGISVLAHLCTTNGSDSRVRVPGSITPSYQ